MEWYLKVLQQHYVDFGGRARRKEYWMFCLMNFFIVIGLTIASVVGVSATGIESFSALPPLYNLAVLLPAIGVSVRRMHDIGKSGWWLLVGFVPLIGALVLLYFACLDSEPGNNMYGPNPKGI